SRARGGERGAGAAGAGAPDLRLGGGHPDGRRGRVPERLRGGGGSPLRASAAPRTGGLISRQAFVLLTPKNSDVITSCFAWGPAVQQRLGGAVPAERSRLGFQRSTFFLGDNAAHRAR